MTKAQSTTLKKLLRQIVALRDGEKCAKCSRRDALHLSHVKGEGAWPRLKFEPLNVKFLCMSHHLYWWHKDVTEAAEWFAEKYPDRNEALNEMVKNYYSLPKPNYEKVKEELENMIFILSPKKGFSKRQIKVIENDSERYG